VGAGGNGAPGARGAAAIGYFGGRWL